MSLLRPSLLLALAATAAPALADQITCESHGDRAEACGTVVQGSDVHMIQQISNAPCVQGRTWGADNDSIWVSQGCRAVFDVRPPYRGAANADEYRDEPRADTRYEEGHQYASADRPRAVARHACVARVARHFGPDEVHASDVRWIGDGLLEVSLDTPRGAVTCTADRDGNVRSVDRQ